MTPNPGCLGTSRLGLTWTTWTLALDKHVEHFQIEGFRKALSWGTPNKLLQLCFKKNDGNSAASASMIMLDHMLTFSQGLIPTSLLKLSDKHNKRAINMFADVLKYMGATSDDVTYVASIKISQKLLNQAIQCPDLKDELYMHLIKQTRGNPNLKPQLKAWELFYLVMSYVPPSKLYIDLVTEYIRICMANADSEQPELREGVGFTWHMLNRSAEASARHTRTLERMLPSFGQIAEALKGLGTLEGQTRQTTVFLLNGMSLNLTFDSYTTILESVEQLASNINLQHHKTFSLFECKPMVRPTADRVPEEHIALDDHKYIADVLYKIQPTASHHRGAGEPYSSRLLFKKRIFLQTDETVTETVFVVLSYLQAQFEYLQGKYPDVRDDDAAQMCALQVQVESGPSLIDQEAAIMECIQKYFTKSVLKTRPKDEWLRDVTGRYKALAQFSNEEACLQFLRILGSLPYGNSIFFSVKRIEDPTELLPAKLIIGINKRGVHFFRSVPRECLHTAELKNISQFVSTPQAVCFKVGVGGVPQLFKFETHQGDDICKILQTHMEDRRKWISEAQQTINGDRTLTQSHFEPKKEEHVSNTQLERTFKDTEQHLTEEDKGPTTLREWEQRPQLLETQLQQLAFKKEKKVAAMHQVWAHLSCQHRLLR
jgi:hypothetical protein